MAGLEPATIRLTAGRSAIRATYHQSEREVSNLRHAGYKPVALPLSYVPLADDNHLWWLLVFPNCHLCYGSFRIEKTIFNNNEGVYYNFYCYILYFYEVIPQLKHLMPDVVAIHLVLCES